MKDKSDKVYTPTISVFLRNEEKKTVILNFPTSVLQKKLADIRSNGQESFVLSYKGFKRTLNVKDLEKKILQANLAQSKKTVPIPSILTSVLSYCYDREALIYEGTIEGRDSEREKLTTFITSAQKSNCVMIGSSGVGKTTIVEDFSKDLIMQNCPEQLKDTVVLRINLNGIPKSFLKRTAFYNELKRFLKKKRSHIILFFPSLEDLVNYPEMVELFNEELIYNNQRIIAEINPESLLAGLIPSDQVRCINFLPVPEPGLDEVQPLISKKVRLIELENGIEISDAMVRFAVMTSSVLASSTVVNPELTMDVINFASMNARVNGEKAVTKKNILAFYNINFKLMDKMDEKEKIITAYHEIGHYVVSKMVKNVKRSKNAFVSILPIESALGLTASYAEEGKQLTLTREYYLDQIAYSYGGRTGEYLYTKTYSSGASADIEEASEIAEQLVLSGGLSQNDDVSNKSYMWGGMVKDYLLTDEEKKKLSEEIDQIRAEGFKRAQDICNENADLIGYLVKALVEDGILLGSELDELIVKFNESKTTVN